ncbi:MAG: aldehyde dehydrogenase family protein, partial [Clostridia bacterium]|nr:aldehyde dehydrogenase family protein [Clostridia bacterium]
DYYTEYNDYIITIKIVEDIKEAIAHINEHSTHHSDSIITEDKAAVELFSKEIDSACVFINTTTRESDGFEFGFGAEVGISTQKLHARGPFGIEGLTTYKYVIDSDYLIR